MWHILTYELAVICAVCAVNFPHTPVDPVARGAQLKHDNVFKNTDNNKFSWTEKWYDGMPVDHFAYATTATFRLRYLVNKDNYKDGGPIFFYTGNEGPIDNFARNTGIMFDLAKHFGAGLLFAEHRYYGKTMPFKGDSYKSSKELGYLSSLQALADFAVLIPWAKKHIFRCSLDTPVIAFGGSYGGMLSAWLRMKYPQIVKGAWASSAPMLYFPGGGVDYWAFDAHTTRTLVDSGCSREAIARTWPALYDVAKQDGGLKFLNEVFKIEEKSKLTDQKHVDDLIMFIQEAYWYIVMLDYPYPSNLLMPLPGYPVKFACKYMSKNPKNERDLIKQTAQFIGVYYNYTQQTKSYCVISSKCGDPATSALGSMYGWTWQTCTELILLMCSKGGDTDAFPSTCSSDMPKQALEECVKVFEGHVKNYDPKFFRFPAVSTEYGYEYRAQSNIIFTNGKLDPWSSAGVTESTPGIKDGWKRGIYNFMLEGAAHHLDLRQPNTCDPPPVINARYQIVKIIECWIHPEKCPTMPKPEKLPSLDGQKLESCADVIDGYPWGQGTSASVSIVPNTFYGIVLLIATLAIRSLIM